MRQREILTYPLTKQQFWTELRHFVEYFRNVGIIDCSVCFGFAWGNEYYPGPDWTPEVIALDKLEEKILQIERRGLGEFGHDDVFVELADVEFRFCNDTDIHIGFDRHNALIEDFYGRWEKMGYSPAEWIKNQKNGPGELVRGGKLNV